MAKRRCGLVLAAFLAVSGCAAGTNGNLQRLANDVKSDLNDARAQWRQAEIGSYQIEVTELRNEWARGCTWITEVSAGTEPKFWVADSSTGTSCHPVLMTVEELHDQIERLGKTVTSSDRSQDDADQLDITWNDVGVPATIDFDLVNVADEESSQTITFTVG